MRNQMSWTILAVFSAFVIATPGLAADRPSTDASSSTAASQGDRIPGNIPQTGDEDSMKDAELIRGKLLKAGEELYTIETSPGTQMSVRTGPKTKYEGNYKGMEGDWIEALVSPDMHIETLKKSTPAYSVEGSVLNVDKEFFVVKDSAGKEIRLNIGNDTEFQGSHKVGDRIRAEFTPDGKALSIKPTKVPVGPPGA
jgi:hypothetical protein